MKKIMISIDENVLERINNYSSQNGVNRSAFITMACTDYLNARDQFPKIRDEFLSSVNELTEAMKKFK